MNKSEVSSALATISYQIESSRYSLDKETIQQEVFKQIEKDANMVGLEFPFNEHRAILDWYKDLKEMMTGLLMNGDVRSFLYRIDVSERKIHQIDNLSVDDLCILVLEREFKKVCIRRHFSPEK